MSHLTTSGVNPTTGDNAVNGQKIPDAFHPDLSNKDRRQLWAKWQHQQGQDIGPPPSGPKDAHRHHASCASLLVFLQSYFPQAFTLPFSGHHFDLITDVEIAINAGLLNVTAMPRGSGKSSLLCRSAIWALLTGRRRFVLLVGSNAGAAKELMQTVKTELLWNELLAEDFGRELHCIHRLEGEPLRCRGQRSMGVRTGPAWTDTRVCLGHLHGVETSGGTIHATGLDGRLRGITTSTQSGEILRPDLALVDDPQTATSATSPTQVRSRFKLVMGDLLGCAGPGKTISALVACTVIARDDLASRLLDREHAPEWTGRRVPMVAKWPTNQKLWTEYLDLRKQALIEDQQPTEATEFYAANQDAMDAGHEVYWPERYPPGCLSAIQHAYDLRERDPEAFASEYQNEPEESQDVAASYVLTASDVARRTSGHHHLQVPPDAESVFAFIDISQEVLFYSVMAFEPNGRGHVIDYGGWPEQPSRVFDKYNLSRPASKEIGTHEVTSAVYGSLERLVEQLAASQFIRPDGAAFGIDRIGIDASWGSVTDTVRRFIYESHYRNVLRPCFGKHVEIGRTLGKSSSKDRRSRVGDHWRTQSPPAETRGVLETLFDANEYKSRLAQRLLCPVGDSVAITLYEANASDHVMLAEHCVAERPILQMNTSGMKQIVWREQKLRHNDFWDCLVGCLVLASQHGTAGGALKKKRSPKATARQKELGRKFEEKMAARRAQRRRR